MLTPSRQLKASIDTRPQHYVKIITNTTQNYLKTKLFKHNTKLFKKSNLTVWQTINLCMTILQMEHKNRSWWHIPSTWKDSYIRVYIDVSWYHNYASNHFLTPELQIWHDMFCLQIYQKTNSGNLYLMLTVITIMMTKEAA